MFFQQNPVNVVNKRVVHPEHVFSGSFSVVEHNIGALTVTGGWFVEVVSVADSTHNVVCFNFSGLVVGCDSWADNGYCFVVDKLPEFIHEFSVHPANPCGWRGAKYKYNRSYLRHRA
jgi:hypothetical protein